MINKWIQIVIVWLQTGSLTIVLLANISNHANAQVHNYDPITHFNFNSNPSVFANYESKAQVRVNEIFGNQSFGMFHYSGISATKYFNRIFSGVGISSSRVKYGSSNYNHVAVGYAYRNVIFDNVYIKGGFTYNLVNINSPIGYFEYLSFTTDEEIVQKSRNHNLDWSVTISDGVADQLYLSFGRLNGKSPFVSNGENDFFPQYSFLHLGNFGKLLRERDRMDFSYTYLKKTNLNSQESTSSHFIQYAGRIAVSRQTIAKYGLRIGYVDDTYFHITPKVSFVQADIGFGENRHDLITSFFLDLGIKKTNYKSQFNPLFNFSIIYKITQ